MTQPAALPRPVLDHVKAHARPPADASPWRFVLPGDVIGKDGSLTRGGTPVTHPEAAKLAAEAAKLIETPNWDHAVVEEWQKYSPEACDLKVHLFGWLDVEIAGKGAQKLCMGRGHWSYSFAHKA